MKGPFNLEIKSPLDPTKSLPIRVSFDVKRETITREDIQKISEEIRQQGIHLRVILTDKNPQPEALEDVHHIPQVVLIVVEHRDLIKMLVIALAKIKGVEIDSSLLLGAYKSLIDKFALKDHIEKKWVEKMTEAGYLLACEGFVDKTAQACRFFINSVGRPLSIQESWEYSWDLRNLLPFGIKSEIIPDMGIEELKRYVEVLRDYGFLYEENGKYFIQQHPTENRIIELLEYYGGMTTKSTLAKHFVFREAASRIFDSILEHMERKLLIQERHGNIHLMTLSEVKSLREKIVEAFEECRKSLNQIGLSFAYILTWKEREWHIVPLNTLERVIESLLKEVSTADNQDVIRSRTFIVDELVEWYRHYVNKVILSFRRSSDMVTRLGWEMNNILRKFNEIFENIIKTVKAPQLKVELQELNEIAFELEEVKKLLTQEKELDVLESEIKQIAGDKKSRDPIRTDKLWTDIDEEMKNNEGVKGEWTVAKYLLTKKKVEEIQKKIDDLNITLESLDKLSQEMVSISDKFSEIFTE
jgi:tetrahydromethanopterin S-methyltransferase subunit G